MCKILFVVAEFPPVQKTGALRTYKLLKQLNDLGEKCAVLTIEPESAASLFHTKIDRTKNYEITGVKYYHMNCESISASTNKLLFFLNTFFRIQDGIAGAIKPYFSNSFGSAMIDFKPDVIYTSLPPFSMGKLVLNEAYKNNIPVVLDKRDHWSHWVINPYYSRLHYEKVKYQEGLNFKMAAAVIGVTPQLVKTFKKVHPKVDQSKFHYIPNSFENKLSELKEDSVIYSGNGPIRIGYFGSFYYQPKAAKTGILAAADVLLSLFSFRPRMEDWLYRSPYFFLKALGSAVDSNPKLKNRVTFELAGNKPEWLDGMLKEFNLESNFVYHGYLPKDKLMLLQDQLSLLLVTSEKIEGDEHYCLPSKIFEFIGGGIPVLGFVTDGISKEFIKQSKIGVTIDPDDVNAGIELENLLTHKIYQKLNFEYLDSFSTKNTAKSLQAVFKSVIHKP